MSAAADWRDVLDADQGALLREGPPPSGAENTTRLRSTTKRAGR